MVEGGAGVRVLDQQVQEADAGDRLLAVRAQVAVAEVGMKNV
ncbi:hypothetical protein ACFV4Q_39260 [Streptomyces nojiriensis]